ncbi:hypothetical protein [Kitasatospora sp. NPDC001683]
MSARRGHPRPKAGHGPRECEDLVVAVVRGRRVPDYDEPEAAVLRLTDRVIVSKSTDRGEA